MDANDLNEYVPGIGDLWDWGQLCYKIAYWISGGRNEYNNSILTQMLAHTNNALKADNMEEAVDETSCAIHIGSQLDLDKLKKYQAAIALYLLAKSCHIFAVCNCALYCDDLKKLKDSSYFRNAKTYCKTVLKINKTMFTENRGIIDEVREMAKEELASIKKSKSRWKKQCRALDKKLHPWKYRLMWIVPLAITILAISCALVTLFV